MSAIVTQSRITHTHGLWCRVPLRCDLRLFLLLAGFADCTFFGATSCKSTTPWRELLQTSSYMYMHAIQYAQGIYNRTIKTLQRSSIVNNRCAIIRAPFPPTPPGLSEVGSIVALRKVQAASRSIVCRAESTRCDICSRIRSSIGLTSTTIGLLRVKPSVCTVFIRQWPSRMYAVVRVAVSVTEWV